MMMMMVMMMMMMMMMMQSRGLTKYRIWQISEMVKSKSELIANKLYKIVL